MSKTFKDDSRNKYADQRKSPKKRININKSTPIEIDDNYIDEFKRHNKKI